MANVAEEDYMRLNWNPNRIAKYMGEVEPNTSSINIINNYIMNVTIDSTGSIANKELPKMKTMVVLKPGEDGYIVAECPAMPGCVSQGKTEEEAIKNIKEAIELYIEVSKEYNLDEPYKVFVVEV